MKLWILRPLDNLPGDDNPWEPWYDKAFGFVVRAETEADARKLAHENAGDENRGEFLQREIAKTKSPWLDGRYSSCVELTADGPTEVILEDIHSA